jgi:acyl-CoA dehydrogenase
MDFELNREQKEIQKAVRDFVKGEFKTDIIETLIEEHAYPVKIWKKAAELGFVGIHFPEDYSGMGLSYTAEVNFKDVRVPITNLVGKENKGFYQVLEFFDESRILVAAQALGTAQGAFDRALAYVKQREQFGKKIAQFQITQHKLADMATKIETARLLTYKAAWNFDQGRIDPKLTSMAKMYAARTSVEVCDEAIQLLGGYGYMLEYEVERFYRDAKITEIWEGTKEIQKNTIASTLIGKLK